MIDFKELKYLDEEFADFRRKLNLLSSDAIDIPIKTLSIRYWYESLRAGASLTIPSQLQEKFEPDAISRTEKGTIEFTKNKWSGYGRGDHRPQKALLAKVELVAPGSTRALDHPLWLALDITKTQILKGDEFLRRLTPEIQCLVLQPNDQLIASANFSPFSKRRLDQILRKPNLDALACLTWLLRKAHANQDNNIELIFTALHNALIMLAMDLQSLNIALPLIRKFIDNILPLGLPPYLKQLMTPEDYLILSFILNATAHHKLARLKRPTSWKSRSSFMLDLLNGKYGFDMKFAMMVNLELVQNINSIPQEVKDEFQQRDTNRMRAWRRLLYGAS
ncbi:MULTISPECIES: hypothetical protein [Pseudomonas fluorescens group]|jgi:hypothetical protein|nr:MULTISPECIES: hypothetical protein [Pseudomonas fluorescens group]MDR7282906.1 hypothetical protein [Pseudomonas corrugata]